MATRAAQARFFSGGASRASIGRRTEPEMARRPGSALARRGLKLERDLFRLTSFKRRRSVPNAPHQARFDNCPVGRDQLAVVELGGGDDEPIGWIAMLPFELCGSNRDAWAQRE